MEMTLRKLIFPGYRVDKEINKYKILCAIRNQGPISIPELTRLTNLSRPTVDETVNLFYQNELIVKDGPGEAQGGRRPNLWKINKDSGYLIGVDMETPRLNIAVTDLQLNIIQELHTEFDLDLKQTELISFLIEQIKQVLDGCPETNGKLIGMAVGVPGLIDQENGISRTLVRIPEWYDVPLVKILGEEFDVPIYLENDVRLMAIGEKEFNPLLRDVKNLIYVGYRTGIGACVFINGKPFKGVWGNAGYIGHITVEKNGLQCSCGNQGCMELYADESAIVSRVRQEFKTVDGKSTAKMSFEDIIMESTRGDRGINQILKSAAEYLAIGIANAVLNFEIPTVVIGGSITIAGEQFLAWVRESCQEHIKSIPASCLDIQFTDSMNSSVPIGGPILILQELFREPEITFMEELA